MTTLKRIVLIRPGETHWNVTGRFQGWVAIPLNGHGKVQAQRLANFIRHIGLGKLYTSDLARAKQTADILGAALGFDVTVDQRLREQNVGMWQGLTVPEMHGWYPEDYAELQADPENFIIPAGESRKQVRERAVAALQDYIAEAEHEGREAIGVLSHTTTIRLLLDDLLVHPFDIDGHFGNTSVTTVALKDEGWQVTASNDVMHLEGLESRFMPDDMRGDDSK